MKKRLVFGIFYFFVSAYSLAQEVKWGAYSEEELALESVPFEPNAKVVTLFEEGKTGLSWRNEQYLEVLGMATEYHYRHKILDNNSGNFGNFTIPFFQAGEMKIENILQVQAQVSYLEDGERKLKVLTENDIKLVDLGEGYMEYRIIFPNSSKGSILEYKYIKFDRSYYSLDGWLFQSEYPKLISRFLFEVPDFLKYQLVMQGAKVKSSLQTSSSRDRFIWDLRDIPSIRFEPYISSPVDYMDFVEGFLSYNSLRPNPVLYSTWENLGEELMASKEFKSFSKSTAFKKLGFDFDPFEGGSQLSTAKKIFEFVSENFMLEPSLFSFPTQTLADLIRRKSGNHVDLNLLFISILKSYEIEADLVLIHQIGMGRTDLIPSPNIDQFTASIVRFKTGDEVHYVDATDPVVPFGLVGLTKMVSRGFLVKSEESSLIPVRIPHQSTLDLKVSFGRDSIGNLDQRHEIKVTDASVLSLLESLKTPDPEEDMGPDPYLVSVEDNFRQDHYLMSSYHLPVKDEGGSVVILDPFSFSSFSTNLFTDEERKFPIEFQYPFVETITVRLDLPEGFEVDEYPSPISLSMSNNELEFNFEIVDADGIIELRSKMAVNVSSIPAKSYPELQKFFRVVSAKLSEPLVLEKSHALSSF